MMTYNLFQRLKKKENYNLITPNMAKGVLSSLISSKQNLEDIEIYQKIGQAFSADNVMAGYIYRWQERDGTDYSAKRPASVAFDLYLIRTRDKSILWKGRFDKTQKSLSENILDVDFFLKSKGKWMTVSEMADLGLDSVLGHQILQEKE
jgi:hypothetical protein